MSFPEPGDFESAMALVAAAFEKRAQDSRRRQLRLRASAISAEQLQQLLPQDSPRPLTELVRDAIEVLSRGSVQGAHPGHFGFFRGATGPDAILADALVALFDPQLALRVEAPALCELEDRIMGELATRFDMPGAAAWATTGASESNRLALLAALALKHPEFADRGLSGLAPQRVYASEDAHGSLEKTVIACGLGRRGLKRVGVTARRQLDLEELRAHLQSDLARGIQPLALVATIGTTSAGAADDLQGLADLAQEFDLFLHVDAAWGGMAAFASSRPALLKGLDRGDSLAFDGHKCLGLPNGSGFFFTRDQEWPSAVFDPDDPNYMPERGPSSTKFSDLDPYRRGPLWSQRLKTLSLCFRLTTWGWSAVTAKIDSRFDLARKLEDQLQSAGWEVLRLSELPLLLFRGDDVDAEEFARRVRRRGRVWLAAVKVDGRSFLRVAVANWDSDDQDVEAVVKELDGVRRDLS